MNGLYTSQHKWRIIFSFSFSHETERQQLYFLFSKVTGYHEEKSGEGNFSASWHFVKWYAKNNFASVEQGFIIPSLKNSLCTNWHVRYLTFNSLLSKLYPLPYISWPSISAVVALKQDETDKWHEMA